MADAEHILDRLDKIARFAEPWWRPYHEAMTEEDNFLQGDRYEDDFGLYNKDRRLIQIRGQETSDAIRHKLARATERPRSIEARPRDDDDDVDSAELAAALVEGELGNPFKGYEEREEEAIQAALEHRMGAVMMDYDHDWEPFGEIFFRYTDGRGLMWEPGFHPHEPQCGWLKERKRLDVDYARKKFGASWLMPDRELGNTQQWRPGVPLISGGHSLFGGPFDDDKVTLDCWWFKNDRSLSPKKVETGYDALRPGDRYMVCDAVDPATGAPAPCGYRSDTQDNLKRSGQIESALPEELDFCPRCQEQGKQGSIKRIDAKAEDADVLAYKAGRRYVVHAPFSANPDRKPLVDGGWPIPRARSFPIFLITAYSRGGKPMGPSDTTLLWDVQVAADNLRTQWIDQTFAHKDYWGLPAIGLIDPTTGEPWQARDDQYNVFLKDMSKAEFGALTIDHYNGTGIDENAGLIWGVINGTLTQYRGQYDQGPVEDRSVKSGVALKTENAIGEIPVEHFKRRLSRARGMFAGVVYDYIAATYTPARMNRLNLGGTDMLMSMWGDDLPNYDFVIGDSLPWTGIDKERSEGFQQGIQIAQQWGPDALEAWGHFNEIPRSAIRSLQKVFAAMQTQVAPAPPPVDSPVSSPGAGAGAPPAESPEASVMPPEMAGETMGVL